MKKCTEYEVFILNTSGLDYRVGRDGAPYIDIEMDRTEKSIKTKSIPLTPENLPTLYELDVEYMERFVFSIPERPAQDITVIEDPAFIDWYENTLPTQIGRSVLWENGWYAEDSVSLVRLLECAKKRRIMHVLEKNDGLCLDTEEERSKLAEILADEFEEITGHPV